MILWVSSHTSLLIVYQTNSETLNFDVILREEITDQNYQNFTSKKKNKKKKGGNILPSALKALVDI